MKWAFCFQGKRSPSIFFVVVHFKGEEWKEKGKQAHHIPFYDILRLVKF